MKSGEAKLDEELIIPQIYEKKEYEEWRIKTILKSS